MRLPSAPARAHERNKPVHFTYVGTDREKPWEAYLAGPIWWGYLHMLKPSKPCVYELTGGKVECRYCGRAPLPKMKGWVPLYRYPDTGAVCVPVDEGQRDDLDKLPTFTRVIVGRMRGKGASVYVRLASNQEPKWSSSLPERSNPADISDSLLTMWDLPEVFQFFSRPAGDNAMSLPEGTAVNDRGEPFSGMMQAGAKRFGAEVVPTAPADDEEQAAKERELLRAVQRGGTIPIANGKHKPRKG